MKCAGSGRAVDGTCFELPDVPIKRLLSSVAVKRRKWLLAASALASSSLGISGPALAANECGALDASGSVTCTSTPGIPPGTVGNPYPTGITYGQPLALPLNVTLNSDVNVTLPVPGIGVALNNFGGGGLVLLSGNGATINVTNPAAGEHRGLYVETQVNNATITASGPIDVSGGVQGSHAIKAFVNAQVGPGNASVTYNGPGLSSTGANSTDIQAQSLNGNATIDASGNMSGHVLTNPATGANDTFVGLFANAGGNGNSSVTYRGGTIDVQGRFSNGIFAGADGDGTAQVTTLSGTTIIVRGTLPGESTPSQSLTAGITAELGGAATAGSAITVNAESTINMFGKVTPNSSIFGNPVGIRTLSRADAPITVNYTGPGITTEGGGGIGILALVNNGGGGGNSGGVTVASSGPIKTNGVEAIGIVADSGTIYNVTHSRPQLGPGGNVTVTSSGAITTQGAEAHGIWAASTTGTVLVDAFNNVSATGQFSTGINAISNGVPATATPGGNVTVNVAQGVSVNGGWQAGVTGVGSSTLFALPAAGVILNSTGGTATLNNGGSIGALSDRAVASTPQVINNRTIINNDGTITGFVQLSSGDNSLFNNNTFNLRHFADTIGSGVRDTLRVAIADLGTGTNNSFTNIGTLALLGAPGATTLDATGQYLPLGNVNNAMALNGGPVQGHLVGVQTFTNSGIIDLQSNPVAGDVLVITGARQAGVAGPGTFVSNGGTLKLDTVLNEGGAATRSDTLVVDGTSVGAKGATNMLIRNAGGAGALTQGDGILVVQVLDPARSVAGAFVLPSGELRAGAFDYALFHGGVNGSNPSDWFLRSDFTVPGVPGVPLVPLGPSLPVNPPPEVLPPGVFPIIGPELATYGVIQPIAQQLGLASLGTHDDRLGDLYTTTLPCEQIAPIYTKAPPIYTKAPAGCSPEGWRPAIWGRVFGQQIDNHYRAFADPRADGQVAGFQAGADFFRSDSLIAGHKDYAGLYFAYGNANVDVNGLVTNAAATAFVLQHTGNLNLNAYSGGAYWTHYGPSGWYTDLVLQGTSYNGNASTQFANLGTNGTGFISSLETGYPILIPLLGPGFVLEPQGQILWQWVGFDRGNDGLGPVSLGTTSGLTGRIGLKGKWTIAADNGQIWQPYVRTDFWDNLSGNSTVLFGTDQVPLRSQAQYMDVAAGFTTKINSNFSAFADAGYQFAVSNEGGGRRNGVKGTAGLRYQW